MDLRPENIFNNDEYIVIDKARFENFNELNIDLTNKTILELGCGIGNHTEFLLSKNPNKLICIEGREENFLLHKNRFSDNDKVVSILQDLDKTYATDVNFDIIYNYGLLYHLRNPFEFLIDISKINHKDMILETCVELYGYDNKIIESNLSPSQSINGVGSRPNLKILFDKLKDLYEDVFYPKQPNHIAYNFESKYPLKRIVLICKNKLV